MTFYHFTCDHGRQNIGKHGLILPNPHTGFAWFTDLANPCREALGLSSHTLTCDRMRWRYRVTDATAIRPYRELVDPLTAAALATSRVIGGQPDRWFVAAQPVPARLMLGQRVPA